MQVAVIHHIKDSDGFYSTVEEALKDGPPEGLKLPARVRALDGRTHICLWEATSMETVRDAVESLVGEYADNEYIEAQYVGVPAA